MKDRFEPALVRIDELNLDKECIALPSDYLKVANACAEAKRACAEAERQRDLVEAELGKEIRQTPDAFGLEKVTEAAISAAIQLAPRYQEAVKALNKARYDLEVAQALVWAMESKKKALTMLVDLHAMGFFTEVRPSAAGRDYLRREVQRRTRYP